MNSLTIIKSCRIFLKHAVSPPVEQRSLVHYCDSFTKLFNKITGLLFVTVHNRLGRFDWDFAPCMWCYQHARRITNVITYRTFGAVVPKLFRRRDA